mmetsp:Transcript_24731/g.33425  ORF Transcript_24731/g.33425 Transcript_24731/m.33425 type:complete len:230 (-) Transcript_24731:223-912(-)
MCTLCLPPNFEFQKIATVCAENRIVPKPAVLCGDRPRRGAQTAPPRRSRHRLRVNLLRLEEGDRLCRGGELLCLRLQAVCPSKRRQVAADVGLVVRLSEIPKPALDPILPRPVTQLDRVCEHEDATGSKHAGDLGKDSVLRLRRELVKEVDGHDRIEAALCEGQRLRIGLHEGCLSQGRTWRCKLALPVCVVLPCLLQVERAQIRGCHCHARPIVTHECHDPARPTRNF